MTDKELKWFKEIIATDGAPAAVGPYSQATAAGPLVFSSGILGLVPGKKEFAGDTVEEQTKQAMDNLAAVLEAAGSGLDRVMKITVYLSEIGDFGGFNRIYGDYFDNEPPARATIQAAELPLGALLELDAIALRD